MICLTVVVHRAVYSPRQGFGRHDKTGMSKKKSQTESAISGLTNEAARQRWELFHMAIAHAKKSNASALLEAEASSSEPGRAAPVLSVAR